MSAICRSDDCLQKYQIAAGLEGILSACFALSFPSVLLEGQQGQFLKQCDLLQDWGIGLTNQQTLSFQETPRGGLPAFGKVRLSPLLPRTKRCVRAFTRGIITAGQSALVHLIMVKSA